MQCLMLDTMLDAMFQTMPDAMHVSMPDAWSVEVTGVSQSSIAAYVLYTMHGIVGSRNASSWFIMQCRSMHRLVVGHQP